MANIIRCPADTCGMPFVERDDSPRYEGKKYCSMDCVRAALAEKIKKLSRTPTWPKLEHRHD